MSTKHITKQDVIWIMTRVIGSSVIAGIAAMALEVAAQRIFG